MVSLFFLPLSLIYFLFITLKKIFAKKNIVKAKIISVGNIIVGGTGKTTLIKYILNKISYEKKICVIYKGYGKEKDEIILIRRNFPNVSISEDKNLNGIKKIEKEFDLILIDDGFHCLWIKKDLDILLIDCSNPFDNNLLIPSGFLREPISSIKRCDIIILTHTHMVDYDKKMEILNYLKVFKKPIFFMNFKLKNIENEKGKFSYENFKNKTLVAFSGIGNPFNFYFLLLKTEPKRIYCIPYPDHYSYKKYDIEEIEKIYEKNSADFIVTTEKDYVKVKNFNIKNPLFFLNFDVEIEKTNDTDFDRYIKKL
ncbi:MAG: tetraacyldisaccharide 4'-kinase [Candidatus Omnitrophica bacterium]|nr:tetraacyldisaccharide 4'-kinase [Candidatus Omnitrophota bacterium]